MALIISVFMMRRRTTTTTTTPEGSTVRRRPEAIAACRNVCICAHRRECKNVDLDDVILFD